MQKDETTESIETHREGESSSNICSFVDDKSSLLSDAQILTKDKSRTLSASEALLLPDSKLLKNLPPAAISASLYHVTGETVTLDNSFLEVADGTLIRISTPNPEQEPYALQDIKQKDKLTISHERSPQGIDNNAIARRTENISISTELLTSPILPFSNNQTLADLETDNSYHMSSMNLSASSVTTSISDLEDLPEENSIPPGVNIENAEILRSKQLNNLGYTAITIRQPINTHDIESPDNVKRSKREVILVGNEPPLDEEISAQSLADPLASISLPSTTEGTLPSASSFISDSPVEERRVETIPLESAHPGTEIPLSTEALGSSGDEWRQRVTPICNNEGATVGSSGSLLSDKPQILQNYTNLEISNRDVIKRRFNLYNIGIPKIALSAGDNNLNTQRGLWISVLYGYINQGLSNNIAGYTGHNRGGSIGFDVEINNNNLIGLAYSNIHSMFKFKNNTDKARERAISHIFSIYGQTNLSHNFTLQGLALIARNYVKNNTSYLLNNSQYHLTEKYRVSHYSVETLLNYHYLTKHNLILIPNIGLRYGFAHYAMHNNPHNLLNNSRSRNMTTGIIGANLLLPFRKTASSPLISLALQGAVEYNFNPKVQYILKTINIANQEQTKHYIIPKPPKTAYNIGVSLVTDLQNIQISLEYYYHLYKHYYNHQGSITFKLNF
ncbi:autotransporter outer membrane beta-barrel domain-containing protein [Candidatus Tisiphia endosymbiont of Nemotelus uliginosus]|uniref:autotransporter outer membrane beta-barrel domain-containing protein n=1 Tax=Candidatus Tisiphia endosymbiont of Nemotelus uliginosus TaxID=3077926 RepID=UPI0035C8C65C